jgi:anthranilate synthase component I
MIIPLYKAPDFLVLSELFPQRYPALFESAAPSFDKAATGRFDILAITDGQSIEATSADQGALFFERLSAALAAHKPAPPLIQCSGPFQGGWVVYLSYECSRWVEPKLASAPLEQDPALPMALALRTPGALVFDRKWNQCYCVLEPGFEHLFAQVLSDCQQAQQSQAPLDSDVSFEVSADAPERFLDGVARIHEYLRAGDVFQVNLSRAWQARSNQPISAAEVYRRLRRSNPAPFAALLQHRNEAGQRTALLSSSPERLVQVRGGMVQTRPIAGTKARAQEPEEDARWKATLVRDPKERAEHVMLIDLERNDLGRICQPGSVHVDELLTVESYSHVHHIVSNVRGQLRAGLDGTAVLKAVFPGGTITGCPKVRCMQIIAELEGTARGAYTGTLGLMNHNGDMDFNILIRTMTYRAQSDHTALSFRAGAGIVIDSDAQRELAETEAKARGLLRALGH